jgi:CCR4-NOT transcription complex subunit 1
VLIQDLEAVMVQLPIQSLAALPPNHDIRHLVRQILFLAAESADRHRTPLLMSQKIVQLLYKTPSQLGREVYVALLDQLCRSFEDVAKEAITWLLYAEDEVSNSLSFDVNYSQQFVQRKFNVPVTVTLLQSGLVDIPLQDQQLAKSLFTDPRPSLLNFASALIRECLSTDPPVASQSQFAYSIEVLGQLGQSGKANEE